MQILFILILWKLFGSQKQFKDPNNTQRFEGKKTVELKLYNKKFVAYQVSVPTLFFLLTF